MSSGKWRPSCLGLNVLTHWGLNKLANILETTFWTTFYKNKLEQLERLRSEDTPRRPMIIHTIDQFILNPKSILLTSSYQIPSQNKVKAEKLEKIAKNLNFKILL